MEQKKIWGLEWEPQVKQTALLASPIYIEQAQEGEEANVWKEEAKTDWGLSFVVGLPSHLKGVLSFVCQIKLWAATEL